MASRLIPVIVLALMLVPTPAQADAVSQSAETATLPAGRLAFDWVDQFGGSYPPGSDQAYDLAVGVDERIVVGGEIGGGAIPGQMDNDGRDAFVRVYDSSGAVMWTDQFGGVKPPSGANDLVRRVAMAPDGRVYATGETTGALAGNDPPTAGGRAEFVRAYSPTGAVLWTDTVDAAYPIEMAVADDGTVVIAGQGTITALPGETGLGKGDAFVRAYSSAGEILWTDQFGTPANDIASSVTVLGDRIVVGGNTGGSLPGHTNLGYRDAFVRAYSSAGEVVWTDQFGTDRGDEVSTVLTGDDRLVAVGTTAGSLPGHTNRGKRDVFVRSYAPSGQVLWTDQFGTARADELGDVAVDADGTIALGSYVVLAEYDFEATTRHSLRSYRAGGSLAWTTDLGGTGGRIAIDSAGTTIVVGRDVRFYSTAGTQLGPTEAGISVGGGGLALTSDDDIVVAGRTFTGFRGFRDPKGTDAYVARLLTPPDTPPSCDRHPATIIGTPGPDVLTGTPGADVIVGMGGDDVIRGLAGDDLICAGVGLDTVLAGAGDDTVFGERGHDKIRGGNGRDTIDGGPGNDVIAGKGDDDELVGGRGVDRLDGGEGNDLLKGEGGSDTAVGGIGDDQLFGGASGDELRGGPGSDNLNGGNGTDQLYGDGGDDGLAGGSGEDLLVGGAGDDVFAGGPDDDIIRGAQGDDQLRGGLGNDELRGSSGDDVLKGERGDDDLDGGDGRDRCNGGSGVNTFARCETII